ncbi:hypothetical protein M3Y98_00367400 [Aphelenchoides besseyi]|nr:hypothetical protein M3Y98_00367400 [Aphelenchoides besseyi]KAI6201774.1 hypothetical protein M3Y96_00878000 [Aphelenchoides besseyi]
MEKQLAKGRWFGFNGVAFFYVLLLLLLTISTAVEADLENVEPQPKRGNTALLSRYGRTLLSRYGKRSAPSPIMTEHRILNDYDEGEWLLCRKVLGDLVRCSPFTMNNQ